MQTAVRSDTPADGNGAAGRFNSNPSPALRIGFNQVKGLSEAGARAIVEARENPVIELRRAGGSVAADETGDTKGKTNGKAKGKAKERAGAGAENGAKDKVKEGQQDRQKDRQQGGVKGVTFRSIQELVFRSGINKKDLEALAAADALRGLSGDRHRAFWYAAGVVAENSGFPQTGAGLDMFDSGSDSGGDIDVAVMLAPATESQNIMADYGATGFTLRRHPLSLLRDHLDSYRVSRADRLSGFQDENLVKVAGIVTCRQRPMTASGVTFITMEDETGTINVVVWPALGERRRPVVRQARLLGVSGHVQHSDGVTHLIARDLVDLTHWLGAMQLSSRDFT
jgi:DNA polymerase III alpha subunit